MPSRLIHYIIANEILKSKKVDKCNFILGNLAPDSHDGTLFGPKGNAHTHFRYIINGEYDKFPNIEYLRFKNKYKDYFDDAFVLGYYCHLIADHIWTKCDFLTDIMSTDNTEQSFTDKRKLLHDDFHSLNPILLKIFNIKFNNKLIVSSNNNFIVDEFVKTNLTDVFMGLKEDFLDEESELKLFTVDNILRYIRQAISVCLENLN